MYKAYGQVFITDDHFLAVVGAFAAIFNAFGRVFWGHMCDKFVSFTVFLSNIIHIKTHWAKKIPGLAASESKLRLEKFQKVRGLRKSNFFWPLSNFWAHWTLYLFNFFCLVTFRDTETACVWCQFAWPCFSWPLDMLRLEEARSCLPCGFGQSFSSFVPTLSFCLQLQLKHLGQGM